MKNNCLINEEKSKQIGRLDPFVEQYTGGAPAWKLLVNAALATGIYPLHAFMERLVKKRALKNEKKTL